MSTETPAFDPERLYAVRITAPVEIAETRLWPGQEVELRGDLVDAHADALELID